MTPTFQSLEWFLKTGITYGLGVVLMSALTGLFIWLLWAGCRALVEFLKRIGPAILGLITDVRHWMTEVASSHMSFIEANKATSERVATAVEKLEETSTASGANHGRTHRTLGHVIAAAKCAAQDPHGMTEVYRLLEAAEKELQK